MINTCLLNLQVTDPMNISEPDSSFAFIREFILLGFSYEWKIQSLLFSLFLTIYALTITGNGAIICALWHDQRLHIPMYIFLGNFSFLEIWYVSSTVPKMLVNLLSDKKTISFVGCFLQFYFFSSLETVDLVEGEPDVPSVFASGVCQHRSLLSKLSEVVPIKQSPIDPWP